MTYFKDPQAFYDLTIGKSIDVDGAYGAQCWDLFAYFCRKEGLNVDTYCSITGYAGDLYKLRYQKQYDQYFDFFYPEHTKRGDWIFWDGHVAMVWNINGSQVECLGQNQGGIKKVTLRSYNLNTALGCMRYKEWIKPMNGWIKSNGKWYYFDKDGNKLTGIQTLKWSGGTDQFIFSDQGVMLTGWQLYNGKWYYFNSSTGAALKGLQKLTWKDKEGFYYFNLDTCAMQTGVIIMTLTFDASGALIGGVKE